MLTTNLWIDAGLVNGSLGVVKDIVYAIDCKPPLFPSYVTVEFNSYIDPPWDPNSPKTIPI